MSIRRNHLANLSVRSKLLINQLVATLLLAALFASAWSGFDSILARGQAATDLERASAALQLVMRGTTEFIVTEGTPSSRKLAQAGIERFDALLANSIAKDSDRLAQEVSPKWHKARKDLLEFLAIPVGKIGVNNDSAMLRFGALTSDVDLIVKTMSDATKSAQEAADADKRQTTSRMLVFLGVSTALLTITSLLIGHSIRRPLDLMQKVINEVEAESDFSKHLNVDSADEVGKTARAFNRLMGKLREIVRNLQSAADGVDAASHDLVRRAEQSTMISEQQSEEVASIAATVEEISTSLSSTSSGAKRSTARAETSMAILNKALGVIRASMDEMARTGQAISASGEDVRQLEQRSEAISGIVAVIKEIADQINLLALNAAIEAARAGEQGRGFAVVADEVRKLAERTTQATMKIVDMIKSIQDQIVATVAAMEVATQRADQSVAMVRHSETALHEIVHASEDTATNMHEIAAAVHEQDTAVRDIATRIEHLAQMAEENGAAAHHNQEVAVNLERLSGSLREVAARYRVSSEAG